jgi:hypothetical protein
MADASANFGDNGNVETREAFEDSEEIDETYVGGN